MDEITKVTPQSLVTNIQDLQTIAQVFVKSGFFQDTADLAKAQVKIMAGREIGLEPFASMSGIHVIKGKVTYGANIMAAKVKGSGRYDYRVKEMTDKACRIMFLQLVGGKWEEIGPSEFTIEDARKAGTQNLDKFPRNMLFARAISNGVKWYCPDVTSGVTMYAPEEFGAVVDDAGVVVEVDGKVIEHQPEPAKPQPAPSPAPVAPAPKPAEPPATDDDKIAQEFRHKALWKKVQAAGLLNTQTVEVWKISPQSSKDDIEAKCELMHIALDPTYGSAMPDPRTGDGENQ